MSENDKPSADSLQHIPPQYLKERWSYDYSEKRNLYEISGGGYILAETEDSEIADAICKVFNELREFSQHPVPAPLYRPSEDVRKAFADSIVDILWDRRELDSRNNTRQKCVDIVMSAFAQYGKVVRSEGEHPEPANGGNNG